jgi:hypothetical protein
VHARSLAEHAVPYRSLARCAPLGRNQWAARL